tara:strand:+ start:238 stop:453 length:216 start_codon:yes stop_codon:yes gene_type:complete
MTKDDRQQKITIEGTDYKLDDLSDAAKAQLSNIQFVDTQIQQLNNELAISDTARIGYTNALRNEVQLLTNK